MEQDKIDRTIEIILQNQAQFHSELQQTQQLQKGMQEIQNRIQNAQEKSQKRIENLEKVSLNLLEVVRETSKAVKEVTKNIDELRAAQKKTDERLNAVIFVAEKVFQPTKRKIRII